MVESRAGWIQKNKNKKSTAQAVGRSRARESVLAKKKPSPAKGRVITDCLGYEGHVWEKTE